MMMLLALCVLPALAAGLRTQRFIIVSSPRNSKVSYMRAGTAPPDGHASMADLITTGLAHPQGIAVDQKRRRLFVSDPDLRRIYAYPLIVEGGRLSVGERAIAAEDTESRWVTVDTTGNMFFSDEPRNQILKISAARASQGNHTPEVVYDSASVTMVSNPGGVGTDNFYTYWVNKQVGTQAGSVVKGHASPGAASTDPGAFVQTLAANAERSYGLCMAMGNIFYTQPDREIFAVKKVGGVPVMITDRLTNPRGCAWDGDGSIYVADRGANALYAFAGNMRVLSPSRVVKVGDYDGAFGVAVFSRGMSQQPSLVMVFVALSALCVHHAS